MTQDTVIFDAEAAIKQARLDGALTMCDVLTEEYQRLDAGKSRTRYKSAQDIVKRKKVTLALNGEVQGFSTDFLSNETPTHVTGSSGIASTFLLTLAAVLFVCWFFWEMFSWIGS